MKSSRIDRRFALCLTVAHSDHARFLQWLRVQSPSPLSASTPLVGASIGVAVRSVNVRGGRPHLLVIAKDVLRATEIARSRVLAAVFVDAGPEVLARARKLGIRDNDVGIDDGQTF